MKAMTNLDLSHLHALMDGLSRKRQSLSNAKTPREREIRQVHVNQAEREIAGERKFLGLPPEEVLPEMSIDDLATALGLPSD